jgi:hypothetical protein
LPSKSTPIINPSCEITGWLNDFHLEMIHLWRRLVCLGGSTCCAGRAERLGNSTESGGEMGYITGRVGFKSDWDSATQTWLGVNVAFPNSDNLSV